jgi:hypothetical protein
LENLANVRIAEPAPSGRTLAELIKGYQTHRVSTFGGADIENVREAATHADIAQTRDYDRNAQKKIADV